MSRIIQPLLPALQLRKRDLVLRAVVAAPSVVVQNHAIARVIEGALAVGAGHGLAHSAAHSARALLIAQVQPLDAFRSAVLQSLKADLRGQAQYFKALCKEWFFSGGGVGGGVDGG